MTGRPSGLRFERLRISGKCDFNGSKTQSLQFRVEGPGFRVLSLGLTVVSQKQAKFRSCYFRHAADEMGDFPN